MKNKAIFPAIALIVSLSASLISCADMPYDGIQNQSESLHQSSASSTDTKIKELEAQIITLLQSQKISESERKKEISALKAELDTLKKKESDKATDVATESDAPKPFTYTLNGYKATVTSIKSDGESILIPSVIDGHAVVAIGSEALSSKSVKRIVLENGIESLDWFAFKGCSSLTSISIPKSVTSIGYGAFDGAPKSLTVECEKDSFALKYAQSYGIKYSIKN